MYKVYLGCGFQQGDNIGIISSTCRHCKLSNSVMCSDSYSISILSLFFLYHPYIPYFLIQKNCRFLVSFLFLLHACMYSHQVSNSNSGLAPKTGLLLGEFVCEVSHTYLLECLRYREKHVKDARCCLQTCNSVVYVVVKGLALGQSLVVIPTTDVLLYARVISPL